MVIGEFAFGVITGLVANTIDHTVSYGALEFFQRRKIERRVEDAVAEVVEPLLPFLSNEHIQEYQQKLLIQTCVNELQPLSQQPEKLFQASLNGQKIFDNLYAENELPREVADEGLKEVYILLFPRIATLLCKIPAAVKDWENESWTENYRRLDEITAELKALFRKVDNLANASANEADEVLQIARRTLAQKVAIELDLTGLRSDKPLTGKFDNFFIHPEIQNIQKQSEDGVLKRIVCEQGDDIFNQLIDFSRRSVIFGAPGSGKSTWSKWLQRKGLSEDWHGIAVRVELRSFVQNDLNSFHHLIRETVGKHLAEEITAARINQWLNKQQIIFILDGFDEIPPEKRDKIQEWIKELEIAIKRCPIVITSRPLTTNHLDDLGKQWVSWNIEPFNKERIIDYIRRWYKHTSLLPDSKRDIDADALASQWQSDPTIEPLTSNPLLLSTLLMVHHLDGSLPSGRAELYNRYVKGMLGLWDDRRKVTAAKVSLFLTQKWQILRGIALYMHLNQKDQLDETEINQLLEKLLTKINLSCPAEDILETLRERTGLIIGPGIYSFIHKSVGEYLVAEAIVQGDQRDESGKRIDRFTLFEHREDDRWNTVIFLWAGIAPIQDLEDFIYMCKKDRSLELAYGILYDQYEKVSVETRHNLIIELINCKLSSDFRDTASVSFRQNRYTLNNLTSNISSINEKYFTLKWVTLRSISGDNFHFLFQIIHKAIKDKCIKCSDINKISQTNFYSQIWYFSLQKYLEFDSDYKSFLSLKTPEEYDRLRWVSLIFERTFNVLLRIRQKQYINIVLNEIKQFYPDFAYIYTIYTVESVLELKEKVDSDMFITKIDRLLKMLFDNKNANIESKLIQCTSSWQDQNLNINKYDLFIEFIKYIEYLFQNNIIEENEEYRGALGFVKNLVKIRDQKENA